MVKKNKDNFNQRKRFKAEKKLCESVNKDKLADSSVEFAKELNTNCSKKKKNDDENGGC